MNPTDGSSEPLSAADIGQILAALERSSWDQAEIVVGEVRIAVGRGDLAAPAGSQSAPSAPPQAAPAAAQSVPAATREAAPAVAPAVETTAPAGEGDHEITAPSVGVFWEAPSPGAPPFVEVGGRVEAGDTIGIVEVMKLMNNVVADVSGTVTAVLVENAAHVEYGTPLVAIKTDD